ncbi:MAG: M48 family metallopeptidase [Desulfobulbaceae bacterium]
MNLYLVFIIFVIVCTYLLETAATILNLRNLDDTLPREFSDVFNQERYGSSQAYTRAMGRLDLLRSSLLTPATILFILLGGFNLVDRLARSLETGPILTGLVFTGSLLLLSSCATLPFSIYTTFVIEERFGFNRTTPTTFVLDILKTILLTILIGAPAYGAVLWFFQNSGPSAWLYCWLLAALFILFMQFLAPALIMPLFNRFTPLDEGELKERILDYAHREDFTLQGIFTMDGSRRTAKLNAFFTGFGRFRRIVFFDTLLEKLDPEETLSVLAHEMGHYKKRHIFKMMGIAILQVGFLFFLLSLFINNEGLFAAFSMEHISVHASLVFFGFLYTPISLLLGIGVNALSRRHEFEADTYAAQTTSARALIRALKKLSAENLSNLTPHPLYVILHYSHPPILDRIRALQEAASGCAPACATCGAREQLMPGERICSWCRAEEESCGCSDE